MKESAVSGPIRDVARTLGARVRSFFDARGTEFVGVWIKYEHKWVTEIFADTSIITDASVIRLEPRKS